MPDSNAESSAWSMPAQLMSDLLDAVWTGVVLGDSKWNPEQSCFDLAEEYRCSGRATIECVENFIDWQTAKAAGGGFLLGLPGLTFGAITIPADLTFTTYLQLRMVATIGLLYGWDVKSDRFKTVGLLTLLGSNAAQAVRQTGVTVGTRITANALAKVPGSILLQINRAVGFRLVTKAGSTGAVNLIRFVPILGGLVSGGLNAYLTRTIGYTAEGFLRDGPDVIVAPT